MAPPPATPTPHRFLVPKRSQSRNETPKAFQSGSQQFQATPRFSVHSTPRGPPGAAPSHRPSSSTTAVTPGPVGTGAGAFNRPTPRTTDPINDIVDSSPSFSEHDFANTTTDGTGNRHDPIEVFDVDSDIDAVPESSPAQRGYSSDRDIKSESGAEEEEPRSPRSRSPKRRRISISSTFSIDAHPQYSMQHDFKLESDNEDEARYLHDDTPMPDAPTVPSSPSPGAEDPDSSPSISPLHARALNPTLASASVQQPTFQKAPRFKPTEAPDGSRLRADPPPDAFSPRRRGAKYVPGGLAASVRDWFVDVWAGAGAVTGAGLGVGAGGEWIARVVVDEVRAAPGMVFVVGRYAEGRHGDEREGLAQSEGSDVAGEMAEGGDGVDEGPRKLRRESDATMGNARIMLAGSPRVVGLERRPEVRPGAMVGVGRPTWEVEIPGQGRWAVACEWTVLR
ncbi:hypothetical protein F5Y04DRAFT_250950 [Hypomontagnella monticulosa]|nr:hypothetical protein F5Y04DRAFT_250950 [Hypomontagnella monticulosa]